MGAGWRTSGTGSTTPRPGGLPKKIRIGLAGGLNLNGFANGDPVNFSDPFGLSPIGSIIRLLTRGFKFVERDIEFVRAVEAVREGEDVLVKTRRVAKDVAREAGGGKAPVGPELHVGEGNRPHFHMADRSGGHIFYSVAAGLTVSHYAQGAPAFFRDAAAIADFFNPLSLPQDLIDLKQAVFPRKDKE